MNKRTTQLYKAVLEALEKNKATREEALEIIGNTPKDAQNIITMYEFGHLDK